MIILRQFQKIENENCIAANLLITRKEILCPLRWCHQIWHKHNPEINLP